ncbi:hypothetical protein [Lewinella cohaerens]|uniref:hypothetical protein n=1 Tax=Lewinella cohaerens TaxID=70995 RepID=UPI00038020AA|nr:hypothetical protein [Lewinella cohaerens]
MWDPRKTLKKGFETLSDTAQDGLHVVSGAAGDAFQSGLAFANHMKEAGEQGGELLFENGKDIIEEGVRFAREQGEAGFDKMVDIGKDAANFGEGIIDGVEEIGDDALEGAKDLAKEGYEAAKEFVEEQLADRLKTLADTLADHSLPVLNWFEDLKEIFDEAVDLGKAIADGDGKKTILQLLKLLKELSAFDAIINKIEDEDIGSIVIYGSVEGGAVVSVNAAIGIVIDIGIFIHMIKNADNLYNKILNTPDAKLIEDYNGAIFAFVAVAGLGLGVEGGVSANLLLGYHVNKPEGVPGVAIDVGASFECEAGASIAVAFDPVSYFPPSLVQIVVGVGVGGEAGVGLGVSYCFNIATMYSDFKIYAGPEQPPTYPTAKAAKEEKDPDVYWNKYSWEELGSYNQSLWSNLGWNDRNWDGPRSQYPRTFVTEWNNLNSSEKQAVKDLGYDQESWDNDPPRGYLARSSGAPDTYWYEFNWDDIATTEQDLWKTLGWSATNWDTNSPKPTSFYKKWTHLSNAEKLAANFLGYESSSWDSTVEDIVVTSAIYGLNGQTIDVKDRIQAYINNGSTKIHVRNNIMGHDPYHGIKKRLDISYKIGDGSTITKSVEERDYLNIL